MSATESCFARFLRVAPFGRDAVRRFAGNVSELKKLAARDFENILQCIIPCFEGLLPNQADEDFILDLLYILSHFHSLAKLRMHTDSSLAELEDSIRALGSCLRHLAEVVCPRYATFETAKELGARQRQAAKKGTAAGPRKAKAYSTRTYKLHAIGHYPWCIRRVGPTDGISTQRVGSHFQSNGAC